MDLHHAAAPDEAGLLVCWGELLWDLFPDGPRLGGAAANVAYHAAQLGQPVALVSRVGNDELGARAKRELSTAGVDVSWVQVDADRPTGTVEVEIRDGEPSYRIASEAAWDRIDWSPELAALIGSARALCYGTLAQRTPLGSGALSQAFARHPAAGLRVCDLNLRPPFADSSVLETSLAAANVIKLNDTEAQLLCRIFAVPDAVEWLLQRPNVIIVAQTRGARGALLASRSERSLTSGHPSKGGDAVGAGDAFTAVLTIELMRGSPLGTVAALANEYAAYVASQPGAMPEVPAAMRERLAARRSR
jgi:fructokinase